MIEDHVITVRLHPHPPDDLPPNQSGDDGDGNVPVPNPPAPVPAPPGSSDPARPAGVVTGGISFASPQVDIAHPFATTDVLRPPIPDWAPFPQSPPPPAAPAPPPPSPTGPAPVPPSRPFTLTPVEYDPFPDSTVGTNGGDVATSAATPGPVRAADPAAAPASQASTPSSDANGPAPSTAGVATAPTARPFTLTPVEYDPFPTPMLIPGSGGASTRPVATGGQPGSAGTQAVPVPARSGSDGIAGLSPTTGIVGNLRPPALPPSGLLASTLGGVASLRPIVDNLSGLATLATKTPGAWSRLAPGFVGALRPVAVPWLTRLAARLAPPANLFNTAFVPSPNPGTMTEGPLPGAAGLRYRLDHDTGTLHISSETDPDARRDRVAHLGPGGLFYDNATGLPIARAAGDAAMATANANKLDQPRLCPAPQPDHPGGRKQFDVIYEEYVRAKNNPQRKPPLDRYWTFALAGSTGLVYFDDCRESDGAMIEAKGNYAGVLKVPFIAKKIKMAWLIQASRQLDASHGRRLEWYFHDAPGIALAREIFAVAPYSRIGVHFLPYPGGVPKPNPRVK